MKQLFIFLTCLLPLIGISQTHAPTTTQTQTLGDKKTLIEIRNTVKIDSAIIFPRINDTSYRGTTIGQVILRGIDSALYQWTGIRWNKWAAPGNLALTNGNGTTFNGSAGVNLGGVLTANFTIDGGTSFFGTFTSALTGSNYTLAIQNSSSGGGLRISALNGTALGIGVSTGIASSFSASSGVGSESTVSSAGGIPYWSIAFTSGTNTIATAYTSYRETTGTAANGIGSSYDFWIQDNSGTVSQSTQLVSYWSNAIHGSLVSQFLVRGVTASGVLSTLVDVDGGGQLTFNKYGVGNFTVGTIAYYLAVTSGGVMVEGLGTGGGTGTVTSVSIGNLSPLFTASVATSTSTPAISFALSTAAANSILGNNTGSSAAPAYFVPTSTTLNGWFGGTIQSAVTLTTTGTSGAATFISNTLNIPNYTFTLPTATTSVLGGIKIDGTSITISSGVISAVAGITGSGSANRLSYWTSSSALSSSANFTIDATNDIMTITTPATANTAFPSWVAQNTGTASSGNQMYGGFYYSTGAGWKTTATAASYTNGYRWGTIPNQAALPSSIFAIQATLEGTQYENVFTIQTDSTANGKAVTAIFGARPGTGEGTHVTIGAIASSFNNGITVGDNANPSVGAAILSYSTALGEVRIGGITTSGGIFTTFYSQNTEVWRCATTTHNVLIGTTTDNSKLTINGSIAFAYVAKTGAYTLTTNDNQVENTTGANTYTLPTAIGITGREYTITNSATASTVTIGTTSSQVFVNVTATPTTLTITGFGSYTLRSNGAGWLVVAKV